MCDWVFDSGAVQMIFEKCSFLTKFKSSLWPDPSKNWNRCRLRILPLFSTSNRVKWAHGVSLYSPTSSFYSSSMNLFSTEKNDNKSNSQSEKIVKSALVSYYSVIILLSVNEIAGKWGQCSTAWWQLAWRGHRQPSRRLPLHDSKSKPNWGISGSPGNFGVDQILLTVSFYNDAKITLTAKENHKHLVIGNNSDQATDGLKMQMKVERMKHSLALMRVRCENQQQEQIHRREDAEKNPEKCPSRFWTRLEFWDGSLWSTWTRPEVLLWSGNQMTHQLGAISEE